MSYMDSIRYFICDLTSGFCDIEKHECEQLSFCNYLIFAIIAFYAALMYAIFRLAEFIFKEIMNSPEQELYKEYMDEIVALEQANKKLPKMHPGGDFFQWRQKDNFYNQFDI